MSRWIRSQRAAVAEHGDSLLLIGRDGSVRSIDGDSAELTRVALAFFGCAHDEAELVAHIESLAGPLGDRGGVVRDLITLLRETGAIEADRSHDPTGDGRAGGARDGTTGMRVVIAISGAIAASHAPALVTALQRRGHTVEVALTQTACRFVAVDTLAAILQREPQCSMWPRAAHVPVPHVALAHWAEIVIVYPASATTIGRIANGDLSELVSAIALTTRAPVVIVPSMNRDMLEAPAVQRNLEKLRADGHTILHGVPSQEVAEAPTVRETLGGAAPAPGEVVATIEALRRAGVLSPRGAATGTATPHGSTAATPHLGSAGTLSSSTADTWNAAYRSPLVPWASDTCDADIAAELAKHVRKPGGSTSRLLDLGCGLGQVAAHAAQAGYRVVATDISDVALSLARHRAAAAELDIVWLRDDICATALVGPFDVIVDRATLHTLPAARAWTWAAAMQRLIAPGGIAIIKCHRDGIAGVTTGWSAAAIAGLLPDFRIVAEHASELPGILDATPVPATFVVLQR